MKTITLTTLMVGLLCAFRLSDKIPIDVTEQTIKIGGMKDFIYKAAFDNGLTEHELDHVFIGTYNGTIVPNTEEVSDYCFKSVEEIRNSIQSHPQKYTEWIKIAFPKMEAYLEIVSN